jgi:single-strand DNA-binding protein
MNNVTLIGRLVRDANYYEGDTTPRALFTLAVDRKDDGADFIGLVAFGAQATAIHGHIGKGHLVAVEGRVQSRSYDKGGETVYVTEIVAQRVDFLARPKSGPELGGAA